MLLEFPLHPLDDLFRHLVQRIVVSFSLIPDHARSRQMFDQAACRMGLPEKEIVVDQCRFQYWNLQPVYQFLEIRGYILLDVNVIKDACQQLKRVLVEDRETALRRQVFDLAQDCAAGANVIGIWRRARSRQLLLPLAQVAVQCRRDRRATDAGWEVTRHRAPMVAADFGLADSHQPALQLVIR